MVVHPPGGNTQQGGAGTKRAAAANFRQVNGHDICRSFTDGRSIDVNANGAAGPHSCSKVSTRIHACGACGQAGRGSMQCAGDASMGKRARNRANAAAAGTGKGKRKGKGTS